MNLNKLDPDDFMVPYCRRCDKHVAQIIRFRKRGAGYVNIYHCSECKHVSDGANWRKPDVT